MPELLSTPSRELVKPEMLSLATEQTLRDESPFFCRSIVRLAAHVNLVIFCVVFFFPQTLQPPPEISHSSVTRQPPHWSRVLTGNCCNTCGFSLSCSCRSARFCWRCSGHLSVIYPCLSLHPFLFANWVQILVQMSTFIHTTHVLWWRLRQLWTHAIGPYWFKPMSTDGERPLAALRGEYSSYFSTVRVNCDSCLEFHDRNPPCFMGRKWGSL